MDINQQLIRWNARWVMMGDFVACKECLLPQQVNDADLCFDHDGGCTNYAKESQYPWKDLLSILNDLPKVTAT